MKKRTLLMGACAAVCLGLYVINASWLAPAPATAPKLLAHRGVSQLYDHAGLTRDACTATRIFKPEHDFLENTLPSIRASLDAGADVVEIDIHPTTDGQFVVFHDWTVDCRTDGHGVTREHTLADLKALDIGHGYTYDGGKTFPFRGRFKGMMPSLDEVLTAFPDTQFLINFKSNDPAEAEKLDAWLKARPGSRPERLTAYGGNRPVARMAQLRPAFRPFGTNSLKACGYKYIALGWSGYMPKACRNTHIFLPQNLAWMAWGYPNRLQERFANAGSYIYLVGDHGLSEKGGPKKDRIGLTGIDTSAQLARVPKSWSMGIMTNAIETMGPAVKAREAASKER